MDIKQAKQELRQTIRAYTARTEDGVWRIPREKQRPVLLMGPPGIGKTAILSQLAQEEHVGLVCYTMTHHTRQSALNGGTYASSPPPRKMRRGKKTSPLPSMTIPWAALRRGTS